MGLRQNRIQKRAVAIAAETEVDDFCAFVGSLNDGVGHVEHGGAGVVAVRVEWQEGEGRRTRVLKCLAERIPKRVHHGCAMSHLIGIEVCFTGE